MNSVDKQLQDVADLQDLWSELFPNIEEPPVTQFHRWQLMKGTELTQKAINRGAKKFYKMERDASPMTMEDVSKYVTSIILHEIRGEKSPTPNRPKMFTVTDGEEIQFEYPLPGTAQNNGSLNGRII